MTACRPAAPTPRIGETFLAIPRQPGEDRRGMTVVAGVFWGLGYGILTGLGAGAKLPAAHLRTPDIDPLPGLIFVDDDL